MFVRQLAAIIAASLMAGCSLVQPVQLRDQAGYFEKAGVENRPVLAPVRSVSSFNDALSCMDRQLAAANLGTVYITSKTLQDPTGKLQIDLKDMVLTSLLRMSRVSNTFRVVDYEVDAVRQDTVQVLTSLLLPTGQMEVRRPQIYISGGVAYSDTNVISKRHNVGLSAVSSAADAGSNTAQGSSGDTGYAWDSGASVIALDLHIGDFNSRTLLPGLEASNEITIGQAGKALDLGARIRKFGFQFEVASNASQGSGAALRSLVDFDMIELIGKWARLPYWQCLRIDRVHPEMQRQMMDWYDDMSQADRVTLASRALRQVGYYDGPVSDQATPALRDALSRWQRDNSLPPMGLVTFETYEKLLSRFVEVAPDGRFERIGWGGKDAPVTLGDKPAALLPQVSLAVNRNEPIYVAGEVVVLRAVPQESGYLACYYQDSAGVVSQVFPNPQQPNPLVEAKRAVMIPDINQPSQLFSLEASDPGTQQGRCFLSPGDLRAALPADYRTMPLTPIAGVSNLQQVADAYAKAAGPGSPLGTAVASWQVVPRAQTAQQAPQSKK